MKDGYGNKIQVCKYVLQREWSASISHTSEEQFLDCEGPPPLEVPKNTTDMWTMVVKVETTCEHNKG
jgi:hypothetical protein